MPPLPTITDTFRVTFNWNTLHGVAPKNVLHFRSATGDEVDVGAAIQIGIAATADPSHLFHCLSDDQECDQIDVLKLDGASATVPLTLTTAVTGGSGVGQVVPQGAGIVSLRTTVRGPRGRGRVYCGPISEAAQENGTLIAASVNVMQTAWEDFIAALPTATEPVALVVASYEHATAANVQLPIVRSIIGTQRRRVDQLR